MTSPATHQHPLATGVVFALLVALPAVARAEQNATGTECPSTAAPCLTLSGGPRLGGTLNGDQWVVGGHARLNLPCFGGLALSPVAQLGFGGNHMTVRPSLRVLYEYWLGGSKGLGIYPAAGVSFLYYVPVGPFASWCNRYDVHACWGFNSGFELGGGLEYRWLGLEVIAGLGGLPAVTFAGTATFPIRGDSGSGSRP